MHSHPNGNDLFPENSSIQYILLLRWLLWNPTRTRGFDSSTFQPFQKPTKLRFRPSPVPLPILPEFQLAGSCRRTPKEGKRIVSHLPPRHPTRSRGFRGPRILPPRHNYLTWVATTMPSF